MYYRHFPKDFHARSKIIHPLNHHPFFIAADGGHIFGPTETRLTGSPNETI